jgi:uncharacterized protein
MDIFSLAAVGLIGVIIYLANQDDMSGQPRPLVRYLLFGLITLLLMLGLSALTSPFIGQIPDEAGINANELPQIDTLSGALGLLMSVIASGFCALVIASFPFRQRVGRVIGARFNVESSVHTTALVLIVLLVAFNVLSVVLSGGVEGIAASIDENSIALGDVVLQQALWMLAALLGVGFAIRRGVPQAIERLGLRAPQVGDVLFGVLAAFACLVIAFGTALIWSAVVTLEVFEQQNAASQEIAEALAVSLPAALIIALAVSIGEELFFRGALQPVFGIFWTSVSFALVHTQYSLTPASLVIFVVSLIFGWLRARLSTNAAIVAHFVYNFIQLALAVVAGNLMQNM